MTRKATRTYGLMLDTTDLYGTTYVMARVMTKEPDQHHPINGRSLDSETAIYDAPRHMVGKSIDGLTLQGYWTDWTGGTTRFMSHEPLYRDVHLVNERKAAAMARTLRAITKATPEGYHVAEWERNLQGIIRGLRLDWVCFPSRPLYSSYADVAWTYRDVDAAFDMWRSLRAQTKPNLPEYEDGKYD